MLRRVIIFVIFVLSPFYSYSLHLQEDLKKACGKNIGFIVHVKIEKDPIAKWHGSKAVSYWSATLLSDAMKGGLKTGDTISFTSPGGNPKEPPQTPKLSRCTKAKPCGQVVYGSGTEELHQVLGGKIKEAYLFLDLNKQLLSSFHVAPVKETIEGGVKVRRVKSNLYVTDDDIQHISSTVVRKSFGITRARSQLQRKPHKHGAQCHHPGIAANPKDFRSVLQNIIKNNP